ncbi:MAG: hypothetical protein ABSH07_04700 [Candidatus Dormibacteria bacterium]|jgi:hypothetical protein
MSRVRRGAPRLAALISLGAGLILGTGIGLPTAHWVAGFLTLTRAPALAAASPAAGGSSPAGRTQPAGSPTPVSSPAPTPSLTPTASPPTCSPLANGEQPLDPLRAPPSGYSADAALDWVGCGGATVPAGSPFTVSGAWTLAVSYTCPSGTAAQSTGPTLTVDETAAPADSGTSTIAAPRGDAADLLEGGLVSLALGAGSYRLNVVTPSACLWHLAVYRGQ